MVVCIGLQTAACGIGERVRMRWQAQGKSAKLWCVESSG
jgi:hypothetical protein